MPHLDFSQNTNISIVQAEKYIADIVYENESCLLSASSDFINNKKDA